MKKNCGFNNRIFPKSPVFLHNKNLCVLCGKPKLLHGELFHSLWFIKTGFFQKIRFFCTIKNICVLCGKLKRLHGELFHSLSAVFAAPSKLTETTLETPFCSIVIPNRVSANSMLFFLWVIMIIWDFSPMIRSSSLKR